MKDKELIEKASSLSYTEWWKVSELIEQTSDSLTRERLLSIEKELYHKEEYHAGLD